MKNYFRNLLLFIYFVTIISSPVGEGLRENLEKEHEFYETTGTQTLGGGRGEGYEDVSDPGEN